jgi:hypothetical protein
LILPVNGLRPFASVGGQPDLIIPSSRTNEQRRLPSPTGSFFNTAVGSTIWPVRHQRLFTIWETIQVNEGEIWFGAGDSLAPTAEHESGNEYSRRL